MAARKTTKELTPAEMKILKWEDENLIEDDGYVMRPRQDQRKKNPTLIENMATRGYDGMIVSKKETPKNGKNYRKVYGITISPDRMAGKSPKGKLIPVLEIHEQGFIRKARSGPKCTLFNVRDLKQTFDGEILDKKHNSIKNKY